jgi:1,2-dihydroxy-3-keto-5-methylthiopentene dioxygenase
MGVDVAWRMPPGEVKNQRAENRCEPNEPVSVEELRELGVLHWRLNPETMLIPGPNGEPSKLDQICKEMGYKNRDEVVCSPAKLPDYETKLHMFFNEHIHEDDEIRLVAGGSGYFDVRDRGDRWVRINVVAGDLIVLPAGIYHRFTMDESDFTHAIRLFKDVPVWTPINRPCDENDVRKRYVEHVVKNPPVAHTVVGDHNGSDNVYLSRPTEFDKAVRGLLRNELRAATRDVLVMYFTGAHNPETKQSWCPDCVAADPIVEQSVQKARALNPGRRIALLQVAIERSSYLNNPEYPLRTHAFVALKSIPTVLVAVVRPASDDDEPGIDVVYRSENPTSEWVENLPKAE